MPIQAAEQHFLAEDEYFSAERAGFEKHLFSRILSNHEFVSIH
jgi:hypothetical protein